jgi:hypothetical protein
MHPADLAIFIRKQYWDTIEEGEPDFEEAVHRGIAHLNLPDTVAAELYARLVENGTKDTSVNALQDLIEEQWKKMKQLYEVKA